MSEQNKYDELRNIITEAMVSMVSGVTGLVPPSGPGAIPDFIQAPIDRAVEKISASLPVGVPGGWISCAKQLPPIRSVLSEPCMLEGQPVPTLYRSGHVITFDGKRVSSGIVEWFHGKMPLSGVTHWMALPAAPEVNNG